MQFEIDRPDLVASIQRKAEEMHQPVKQVMENLVERQLHTETAERMRQALAWSRQTQQELLAANGGKLFSDSADIIRESRDICHC